MAEGYVGRFGDALRRLTALDAQQGAFAGPQKIGGADTAGAFAVAPPGPMQATEQGQAPVTPGPMEQLAQAPEPQAPVAPAFTPAPMQQPGGMIDESGAMGGAGEESGTTWEDLSSQMPAAEKRKLADQIEAKAGDLAGTYQKTAQANGVTPKKRASREHMAMFLAEIALRAAANRGSSNSSGEALAKGVLQTQARRGAIAEAQAERERQAAETRRLESRADTETLRKESREDTTAKRKREETLEDDKRNHQQALELARVQAKLLRENGKKTSIVTQDDGTLALIDEDGNAIDVTKEVEETTPTKGSRGQGTTGGQTKKVRKPVKAAPKSNASGIDQDTILNKITTVETELRKDNKLMRELRSKYPNDSGKVESELRRMAREKVEGDVQSLGGNAPAGGKVTKFSDLN